MLTDLRRLIGLSRQGAIWRPGNARLVRDQVIHRARNAHAGYGDDDHLRAAAEWLGRAQDATGDDGVSGRFFLRTGWSSSYPETTGYIIPTFLALAEALGDPSYRSRAARCVDFLEGVQLPSGAFPGGEVHENRTTPSVFNTAQILHGLVQFSRVSRDERVAAIARRAADWLVAQQDTDGAFRKHAYNDLPVVYAAHASCWIAEAGEIMQEPRWLHSARAHLDWVMAQRDPVSGWFDGMGFDARDAGERVAFTHTIAYTLWGVLHSAVILDRPDAVAAVRQAARAIARRLELSRRLPAVLDAQWRSRSSATCLTGNAQMALIWLRLHAMAPEPLLLNAALKAIDDVKAAQPMMHPHPGVRGGIPGSDPVWGDYIRFALPNWSAKFFIDALLARKRAIAELSRRPREAWTPPADVPQSLPAATFASGQPVRTVLYTREGSHKVPQMVTAWASWGFRPAAVVIETARVPTPLHRIEARVRADGFAPLVRKLLRQTPQNGAHGPPPAVSEMPHDVEAFCAARRIPVIRVGRLDETDAIAAVRDLRPDLAVHAGAGILRAPILSIPRLGTLNAHMGVLPRFRGVNVTEWARFLGSAVGCTVHLVDPGIDTGDIICVRTSDTTDAHSITDLRARVDADQIGLLGEVIHWIENAGTLPAHRPQRADEGVQFFTMHEDLRAVLDEELRGDAVAPPPVTRARAESPRSPSSSMVGV
jgi:folate-dependent phosphoribosylglycinamide formyltransferase PurN